jgi:hypothetical protein
MPARYELDEHGKLRPDAEDFDAVKDTPDDPLKSQIANDAHRYRLALSRKLIRLYDLGQLPLELMRKIEKLLQQPDPAKAGVC